MSSFPYPTTEFAALVLKSDVDLSSNTTWAAIQRTIARQPGFQRQSYGRQLESPDIVILLVGEFCIRDAAAGPRSIERPPSLLVAV